MAPITYVLVVILSVILCPLSPNIRNMLVPKFSQESFSKLSTCHIDLQVLFFEVIRTFDCTILEGYRNQEDQEKAFLSGHSKLHYPDGKHNNQPSMAVDVSPYPIDWANLKRFYWFAGFVMGVASRLKEEGKMSHSVRFGGDWNCDMDIDKESFKDLLHYELII